MEKDHVKSWNTHPKKWNTHPPRLDPSNDEYITVVKKVTLDSLVEFSPHELNSCRDRGKFWPCVGREKEEKEKKKKKEKERKKKIFSEFSVVNLMLSWVSFHGYLALFPSQLKRVSMNYEPLQLETSISLYWMVHLTTISWRFLQTSWAVISPCLSSKYHQYRDDLMDIE